MLQHDLDTYKRRFEAFGWHAIEVDGHDIPALLSAYAEAENTKGRPTVVLARTHKGKGLGPTIEDQPNQHGKALEGEVEKKRSPIWRSNCATTSPSGDRIFPTTRRNPQKLAAEPSYPAPSYKPGDKPVATRKAFGQALAAIGKAICESSPSTAT